MKQENEWSCDAEGVEVATASFTDAHAHTKTQSCALTLGSLLIVVYTKETEDRLIVWAKHEALWRRTAIIMTSAFTFKRSPVPSCKILILLDSWKVDRAPTHDFIYETKNIPRKTANSFPWAFLFANSAPWMWPLVELVWALVILCFWLLQNKSLIKTWQICRASFS